MNDVETANTTRDICYYLDNDYYFRFIRFIDDYNLTILPYISTGKEKS